ncbi:MAG: hydantoinase/oxoprolinase family protein, partial [Xanthobacteraceae bacterium]|nr:hydantoinase/oxoprolinase family protein [Xanthobacteraceae bacterium]
PEVREYERATTTIVSASVGPVMSAYLERLASRLAAIGVTAPVHVMECSGGVMPAALAAARAVYTIESGPAAGVVAAAQVGARHGLGDVISFDMGGTTAKAGVIYKGEPLTTGAALIGGYEQALPVQIAMMDIFEVGTGGGSIARVADGALQVGPQSAGAQPGPACYGRGGEEPTVTDANLLLGRLAADRFLGGEMPLDFAAAKSALQARVAKPLGMNVTAAADGILRIAATAMSYAVKAVTTERGLDAGDFALIAYGGAGPLHAVEVAREIGITRVIIPTAPGVFSAFGMLFSDLRYDFVRTWPMRLEDADFDEVERIYRELEDDGRRAVAETSVTPSKVTVKRAADMRYVGQEHAVTVDLPMSVFSRQSRAAIKRHFDEMHALRYGTSAPAEPAEIVSLRTTVTGVVAKPVMRKIARGSHAPSRAGPAGARPAYFRGRGFVPTKTFARAALTAGNRIKGPALVEEHASTTVLMPGDTLTVDAWGNLVVSVGKGRRNLWQGRRAKYSIPWSPRSCATASSPSPAR